ncbi:MAG: hypothetical protein ACRD8U_06460 [Pyrinomonadaceae bacterium]
MYRGKPGSSLILSIISVVALTFACGPSTTKPPAADSPPPQPTSEPVQKTGFERDLQFIRNGQFTYVWVFSRRDGKQFDKDDGDYLRTNAPQVVDWVRTDDGKRFLAGTNFDLEQGPLLLLRKRFVVENYTGR